MLCPSQVGTPWSVNYHRKELPNNSPPGTVKNLSHFIGVMVSEFFVLGIWSRFTGDDSSRYLHQRELEKVYAKPQLNIMMVHLKLLSIKSLDDCSTESTIVREDD